MPFSSNSILTLQRKMVLASGKGNKRESDLPAMHARRKEALPFNSSACPNLLFSCTLATKPVRGICGVNWGIGGGGGAIETGSKAHTRWGKSNGHRGKKKRKQTKAAVSNEDHKTKYVKNNKNTHTEEPSSSLCFQWGWIRGKPIEAQKAKPACIHLSTKQSTAHSGELLGCARGAQAARSAELLIVLTIAQIQEFSE